MMRALPPTYRCRMPIKLLREGSFIRAGCWNKDQADISYMNSLRPKRLGMVLVRLPTYCARSPYLSRSSLFPPPSLLELQHTGMQGDPDHVVVGRHRLSVRRLHAQAEEMEARLRERRTAAALRALLMPSAV